MEQRHKTSLRKQIRHILFKEAYNLGTQMGDETSIDSTVFDRVLDSLKNNKDSNEKKVGALKKQQGIPAHPDQDINQAMKRIEKMKVDGMEDEIDNLKNSEEELEKAKQEYEKLSQQVKQRQGVEDETSQIQSTLGSAGITNMG